MTVYSSESFYRAKISSGILASTGVPFTILLSKLPTLSSGLLTISPNTENEEIVEYNNVNGTNMTIDIIKRGIKPSSILLTTNGVDYNNTSYYKPHAQNDLIRGDVNHIHINQGIGNSTLATELGVGISKLSVAAVDAGDPIVVGTNDPRVGDASTTQKATVKLSVAPANPTNPIAVGDNDSRVAAHTIASANGFAGTVSGANAHTISTTVTGILKGNGTAMSAATQGTDYYAPSGTDVEVADGGTGRSSHTVNSLIIGGTTTTGAQQSITSGTAGSFLKSNGAGNVPSFINLFSSSLTNEARNGYGPYYYTSVNIANGGLVTISAGNVYSGGYVQIQTSPDNSSWSAFGPAIGALPNASNVLTALVPAGYVRAAHIDSGYTFASSFSVQAF